MTQALTLPQCVLSPAKTCEALPTHGLATFIHGNGSCKLPYGIVHLLHITPQHNIQQQWHVPDHNMRKQPCGHDQVLEGCSTKHSSKAYKKARGKVAEDCSQPRSAACSKLHLSALPVLLRCCTCCKASRAHMPQIQSRAHKHSMLGRRACAALTIPET